MSTDLNDPAFCFRLTLSLQRGFMQPRNARQALSLISSSRWKREQLMEKMTMVNIINEKNNILFKRGLLLTFGKNIF